ncbi:MAG TPA: hypothetical protein VKA51_09120 [Rubrobacteraceae bacterium]|nr:hypothetical protein [Rubrobacteraceae bacterium]
MCGKVTGENCYRVGHVVSAHKLATCEECFDGRKTWMDLDAQYFDDYEDHYKGMEEVRRDYEK